MPPLKENPSTTYSNGRIFGATCISCCQTKTKCDINNPCMRYHDLDLPHVYPPHIFFSCQRRGLADKCRRVTPKTKKRARNSHEEDVVNSSNFKSPGQRVASEALQVRPLFCTSFTSLRFFSSSYHLYVSYSVKHGSSQCL